jgi:hypothetical protein
VRGAGRGICQHRRFHREVRARRHEKDGELACQRLSRGRYLGLDLSIGAGGLIQAAGLSGGVGALLTKRSRCERRLGGGENMPARARGELRRDLDLFSELFTMSHEDSNRILDTGHCLPIEAHQAFTELRKLPSAYVALQDTQQDITISNGLLPRPRTSSMTGIKTGSVRCPAGQ